MTNEKIIEELEYIISILRSSTASFCRDKLKELKNEIQSGDSKST